MTNFSSVSRGLNTTTIVIVLVHGLTSAACSRDGRTPAGTAIVSPTAPTVTPTPSSAVVMKGTVSDTAFRSLAGATIEIVNGPSAGRMTVSDSKGYWGFTGAFDDSTQFRASKEGFQTDIKPLGPFCAACNPNRWVNFSLQAQATAANITGSYTMTITADRACASEQMLGRTFDVRIPSLTDSSSGSSTGNAYFNISPTGATFAPGWGTFEGGVSGNYVGFWFETLVEEQEPGHYLLIAMSAGGVVDTEHPDTIRARGDGRIAYCTVDPTSDGVYGCFSGKPLSYIKCDSTQHSLILTSR